MQLPKLVRLISKPLILVIGFVAMLACALSAGETDPNAMRCLGVLFMVAFYWMTEVIPLAVTALLPFVLLPALSVQSSSDAARAYFNDIQFLFVGSFLFARAMEKFDMHRRIALRVLIMPRVSRTPGRLLLAMMLLTFFMSNWMQNTAVAALMTPLIVSLIEGLERTTAAPMRSPVDEGRQGLLDESKSDEKEPVALEEDEDGSSEDDDDDDGEKLEMPADVEYDAAAVLHRRSSFAPPRQPVDERVRALSSALLLGTAYGCSLGGTVTPIGTGPNLVFFEQYHSLYPQAPEFTWLQWMSVSLPVAFALIMTAFFVLRLRMHRLADASLPPLRVNTSALRRQYERLGPMARREYIVVAYVVVSVILWFSRGYWSPPLFRGKVRDGTIAIAMAVLLFVTPAGHVPRAPDGEADDDDDDDGGMLLHPRDLRSLPWDVIILLGGGFCLSSAISDTTLLKTLSAHLPNQLGAYWLMLLSVTIIVFLTELTSNVASANVLLPAMGVIAVQHLHTSPAFLMLPSCLACSFAFMLPVSTPPNAIVFSSNRLKLRTMMSTGIWMNIASIAILFTWMSLVGVAVLGISVGELPAGLFDMGASAAP